MYTADNGPFNVTIEVKIPGRCRRSLKVVRGRYRRVILSPSCIPTPSCTWERQWSLQPRRSALSNAKRWQLHYAPPTTRTTDAKSSPTVSVADKIIRKFIYRCGFISMIALENFNCNYFLCKWQFIHRAAFNFFEGVGVVADWSQNFKVKYHKFDQPGLIWVIVPENFSCNYFLCKWQLIYRPDALFPKELRISAQILRLSGPCLTTPDLFGLYF